MLDLDLDNEKKPFEKNEIIGMGLLGFVAVIVIGLIIANIITDPPPVIDDHNCKQDVPQHTVVVIDVSDPLSAAQNNRVTTILNQTLKELPIDGKISLYAIDGTHLHGLSSELFSLCKPRDGSQANPWLENPAFLKQRFDKNFAAVVAAEQKKMLSSGVQNHSPLIESLHDLNKLDSFGPTIPSRRIVFISDFIQNSETLTFYDPGWADRIDNPAVKSLLPRFSSVDIAAHLLNRSTTTGQYIQRHKAFRQTWFILFNRMGLKLTSFDVERN